MMPHCLVILRTAFQGWLARQVLARVPEISYDLLQISHNNSTEERRQFDCLAKEAVTASFLTRTPRKFDVLTQLDLWRRLPDHFTDTSYSKLFLSSIDAPVIGAIASRHKSANLITWDDGIVNLLPNGNYQSGQLPWRSIMLRRVLGSEPIAAMRDRIERHYTIFDTFPNIVPPDRVSVIKTEFFNAAASEDGKIGYRYFIGQPLEEVISETDIHWVESEAKKFEPDWYVKHPREREPLVLGIPELNKAGDIAEEAIMRHSAGRPFELIGSFSSTLFTLSQFATRTVMLLPHGLKVRSWLADAGRKLGAEVITPSIVSKH
nr:glycosyltransferase family 52 [Flavimaribacter sediminis]